MRVKTWSRSSALDRFQSSSARGSIEVGRCEAEHVPPDRRERLGAECVRACRVGPEAEMKDLAGGVPRADRAVGADHRRDSDRVLCPAAKWPDPVVDDHRLAQQPEAPCQFLSEEDEVLGPVGAGEAEGGGGEVGRRRARGPERLFAGPYDLDEGRLRLRVVDICRTGVAPPEYGPVAVGDECVRLGVATVDAEEERAHGSPRRRGAGRGGTGGAPWRARRRAARRA